MVTRVTSQAVQETVLRNIFRITEDLFQAQDEISSGKRIRKPSDDPSGLRDTLGLKTQISQVEQFSRNIDNNKIFVQSADTALESAGLGLTRARELGIAELGGASTAQTRGFAAAEIDKIISQTLEDANTRVKNTFIFSGAKTRTQPFLASASGAIYQGDTERVQIEISRNSRADVTLPGSEVFGTDLDPVLTLSTALSDLNKGSGVTPGSFQVTDRAGNTATIAVTSGMTVGDVINAINAAGLNVTASLNADGNALQLTDSTSVILQGLQVSEVSGGTTASDLGILGRRDGNLEGTDLDPQLTGALQIGQLNGGDGATLESLRIVNGAASGTVSLSSASTLNDVISQINGAGLNVTAGIAADGNRLEVVSNDPNTVAVVNEVGNGTTAEILGLGGGRNVLTTLIQLQNALDRDDTPGIIASLNNLESGEDSISESRAIVGAELRRIEAADFVHDQDVVDLTAQQSDIEDTDLTRRASDLAALELALEATLDTTARILQPSLLDFLR